MSRYQYRVEENSMIVFEINDKDAAYKFAEQMHRIFPNKFHEVYQWCEEDQIYYGIFQLEPGDCWKCHRRKGECICKRR